MRRLVQRHRTRLIGCAAAVSPANLPATGVGMNVAVYDRNMNHPSVPGLGTATIGSATRQTVPAYSIVVVQPHRNG